VRKPSISFSVLLPLLALMVWAVLVPTETAYIYLRLSQLSPRSPRLEFNIDRYRIAIPRNRLLSFALMGVATTQSHLVTAANLPGTAGEILISLPTSWPNSWRPHTFSLDSWRCLSWPFFCLPAWWFAGRGIDALLGWHRPRWWTLLIGSLLFAAFAALFFGFRFGMSAEERSGTTWVLWGCALWALLFATFPVAWIRRAFAAKPTPAAVPVS